MDTADLIDVREYMRADGRHVVEITARNNAPAVPNEQLLGVGARLARQGLNAWGDFETGQVRARRR